VDLAWLVGQVLIADEQVVEEVWPVGGSLMKGEMRPDWLHNSCWT